MDTFERIRELCQALPRTEERLSHGAPCFFITKGRQFASFVENHHGDGRMQALWLLAPPGAQQMLVQSDPERFFVPPYVGPSGWVGVRLDLPTDWDEVAGLIEEAHALALSRSGRGPT